MGPWGDRERRTLVALACTVEPGAPAIADRIAEHGPEQVLADHRRTVPSQAVRGRLEPDEVPAMLSAMAQAGVRVVVHGDAEYPGQLADLPEPPLALWVRGPLDLRASALRSVSVVGARACTAYGERATSELVGPLAEQGWTIVSGGAFGIDAAAHRAALVSGGATVAFMACGVDVAYPRAHDALLARIADTGAVVSELPPGSQPLKHRFLARNRLIAGLGRGTIVVEAAHRSGALSTAHRALELGRVLMAVPGPITSMASSGTNRLLHEQSARAVADSDQVVGLLTSRDAGDPTCRGSVGCASRLPAGAAVDRGFCRGRVVVGWQGACGAASARGAWAGDGRRTRWPSSRRLPGAAGDAGALRSRPPIHGGVAPMPVRPRWTGHAREAGGARCRAGLPMNPGAAGWSRSPMRTQPQQRMRFAHAALVPVSATLRGRMCPCVTSPTTSAASGSRAGMLWRRAIDTPTR